MTPRYAHSAALSAAPSGTMALARENPLTQALGRQFSTRALQTLGSGAAAEVPWKIWEDALYEPLLDFLERPGKEFRGGLLEACYRLGGRRDGPPDTLPLIVEALHAGSLIVDDIEDDSLERRGAPALHRGYGLPTALNAGNWLYFWPFALLEESTLPEPVRAAAHRLITRTLLECHYGQALDLSARLSTLDLADITRVVRATTELKTGCLVGLSAALGALAGGAAPDIVLVAQRFGRELGVGLQMLDDLSGVLVERRLHKGCEDLSHDRPTWPWAFLSEELDPVAFRGLRAQAAEVAAGAPPEPLARKLRGQLERSGRTRAENHLEQAFLRFSQAVGPCASLGVIRNELDRLEKSYV